MSGIKCGVHRAHPARPSRPCSTSERPLYVIGPSSANTVAESGNSEHLTESEARLTLVQNTADAVC